MKFLSTQEANDYLVRIGMRIGNWNQIADVDNTRPNDSSWINYAAPKNSQELFNFSQHVAGWLPSGEWKILQIDNSTCLDVVQENFLARLLFGSENLRVLDDSKTLFFEFGKSRIDDRNTELLISNLIWAFLLFDCHGYLVSSSCSNSERLAIQDGFVYFSARDKDMRGAKILLENFERQPLAGPQWVVDIIAHEQDQNS